MEKRQARSRESGRHGGFRCGHDQRSSALAAQRDSHGIDSRRCTERHSRSREGPRRQADLGLGQRGHDRQTRGSALLETKHSRQCRCQRHGHLHRRGSQWLEAGHRGGDFARVEAAFGRRGQAGQNNLGRCRSSSGPRKGLAILLVEKRRLARRCHLAELVVSHGVLLPLLREVRRQRDRLAGMLRPTRRLAQFTHAELQRPAGLSGRRADQPSRADRALCGCASAKSQPREVVCESHFPWQRRRIFSRQPLALRTRSDEVHHA